MAYGRISSYHHSGLKHFLPLNNLFLSSASCSASLPSSKPALSEIHDIISQLWLSNLDYCANKKRPDSGGDCSMWKMWLEVRNPSKLMCISKKSGQNRMECSCRFHSSYCHWVRGGCKYTVYPPFIVPPFAHIITHAVWYRSFLLAFNPSMTPAFVLWPYCPSLAGVQSEAPRLQREKASVVLLPVTLWGQKIVSVQSGCLCSWKAASRFQGGLSVRQVECRPLLWSASPWGDLRCLGSLWTFDVREIFS